MTNRKMFFAVVITALLTGILCFAFFHFSSQAKNPEIGFASDFSVDEDGLVEVHGTVWNNSNEDVFVTMHAFCEKENEQFTIDHPIGAVPAKSSKETSFSLGIKAESPQLTGELKELYDYYASKKPHREQVFDSLSKEDFAISITVKDKNNQVILEK